MSQADNISQPLTRTSDDGLWGRQPEIVARKVAGEYVLVPLKQAQVDLQAMYTLNSVGAFLWEELKIPKTRLELVSGLIARYNVGIEQATNDIAIFLAELQNKNLINYKL